MVSRGSGWRVVGASVAGTAHLREGKGCDDVHAYRSCADDLLLLAVADGASSAHQGAMGAATAVQTALDTLERLLIGQDSPATPEQWLSVLSIVLRTTHEALNELPYRTNARPWDAASTQSAPEARFTPRDFATTLLIGIVNEQWIAVAQIGDGAVVILHFDGTVASLTPRIQSEFINETSFLTEPDYMMQVDYTVLPRSGVRGIALLTDGLQIVAMKYPENTPHQPFFAPLFRFTADPQTSQEALRDFLASERICARTDDDKTLVLAVYQ